MPLDRSKFKAAPISAMKKLDGELGQRKGYSNYNRVGYHSIDQGDNKFRIYPAHPESPDGLFWYPKSSAFLSLETDLYDDDGEKTGETQIKRRPVFTSDIHGPKELSGKDLIKIYIEFAKKKIDELFETDEEKKTAVDLLYNWKTGVSPKTSWIMYADKYDNKGQKTLGLLEVGASIKKEMNKMATEMDPGDGPIAVDPFTDPEDGISIIITKTGERLNTEYKVDFESERKGKFGLTFVPTPLSDEDLEKFIGFKPLHESYRDSFRRRDFELQKEGLMRFDIENEFHFFEDEEFISEVEEFQELVYSVIPEEKKKDDGSDEQEEIKSEKKSSQQNKKTSKSIKETPKVEKEVESEQQNEPEEEEEENKEKSKSSSNSKLEEIKRRLAASKK